MCCGSWTQPSRFIVTVKGSDWLMFDICWQVPGSSWMFLTLGNQHGFWEEDSCCWANLVHYLKLSVSSWICFYISTAPQGIFYIFLQEVNNETDWDDFKIIKISSIQLWGTSVFGQGLVRIWAWLLRRVRMNERRLPSSIRLLTAKHWSDYGTY